MSGLNPTQERLQRKMRAKQEGAEIVRQQNAPALTPKQKKKARERQKKKEAKKEKKNEKKDLIKEFNQKIGIAFPDPPEKYFELRDEMLTEFASKLIKDLSVGDLFVNKQGLERRKGGKSLKSIAYNEIIKRAKEFPQTLFDRIDGIERQISINKAFDEYMIPREQKKRQQEINRKSSIEARQTLIEARERRELKERKMIDEPIRKEYVRETQLRQEISPEDYYESFIEGVKTDPLDAKRRSINTFVSQNVKRKQFKYEARETFNQPNADKFGLKDDGTPRSRKEFAHRFRGKTETEVSDMIDQEVRDRTPEQRGAFVGRASRVLEGRNITDDGILQMGGNRIGAGEFIASQLAKKDIEQIVPEPSKRGFISAEFTPDNMRKTGAISQEEEGLLGIKKRREQQYQKEWSADGTTLRNYGFGVLDQEKVRDVKTRNEAMLNAVALSIQDLTQGKEPEIEEDEFTEFDKTTFKTQADLMNRKLGGIKPPILTQNMIDTQDRIETEFINSDAYIQAENNYALQNRFVDIFEKEPNTLQYLESMKKTVGKIQEDFVSGAGSDTTYVDKDLNTTMSYGYFARFQQLQNQGIEPLQFVLNTKNGSILKFSSNNPIAREKSANGIGTLNVMNEVMLGGRIAFIGHTSPLNSNNTASSTTQGGTAKGYHYGFINVFNNPFYPEENSPKRLILQNTITQMNPLTDIYSLAQRDTSKGIQNLSGGDISITEKIPRKFKKKTQQGEKVIIQRVAQSGRNETLPLYKGEEQIRKGTYLPTLRAEDTRTQNSRQQLRNAQLRASSFPTIALQRKKRFGFQIFN